MGWGGVVGWWGGVNSFNEDHLRERLRENSSVRDYQTKRDDTLSVAVATARFQSRKVKVVIVVARSATIAKVIAVDVSFSRGLLYFPFEPAVFFVTFSKACACFPPRTRERDLTFQRRVP